MTEEWRPIPGCEGYEASTFGVRSLDRLDSLGRPVKGRMMKYHLDKDGYARLKVAGRKRYVHALVALAFHGPCPEGLEVCHRNGDKLDFRPENLYYGTHQENELDKIAHGGNPCSNRTHCPDGHEYTPENTHYGYRGDGRRFRRCSTCYPVAVSA